MLDPAETTKLQQKLDLNEKLIWAGRPKPWAFTKTSVGMIFFGFFWCAIVSVGGGAFMYGCWFDDPANPALTNDGGEAMSQLPLLAKLGMTAFFIPFVVIGLGMLFNPLWTRIWSSRLLYAVTDKRAIRKGHLFTKSWRASEIYKPDRVDKRSGMTHIFFTLSSFSQNGHREQAGFRNLPSHEADAAERALRELYASADDDE